MPPKKSTTIELPENFSSLTEEEKFHFYILQADDTNNLDSIISGKEKDFDFHCLNYEIIPEEVDEEDTESTNNETEAAAKNSPPAVVETLLQASVRVPDRINSFIWLLQHGADPSIVVPNLPSVFHLIVESDDCLQYLEILKSFWGKKMRSAEELALEQQEEEGEEDEPDMPQIWNHENVLKALNQEHPETKRTPILVALKKKDAESSALLLELGAKFNFNESSQFDNGDENEPLYHYAVRVGDIQLLECLWNCGISPFVRNYQKQTVLHVASLYDKKDIIDWLQKKLGGKLPEEFVLAEDSQGNTVVEICLEKEAIELLKHWTSKLGADINHKNALDGMMCIHRASFYGNQDMVDQLVSTFKVKVTEVDESGNTPIHYACSKGNADLTKYFIDKKADSTVANTIDGTTPLHLAAYCGSADIVQMLLGDKKANVNVTNNKKETPLHLAASQGQVDVLAPLQEQKDFSIELEDFQGYTALERALNEGQQEMAAQLIEKGADFDREYKSSTVSQEKLDASGYTYNSIFQQAVCHGYNHVVKAMVESGRISQSMVNRVDSNGCSPLHNAVSRNNVALTELLLQHEDIDVNLVEKSQGHTALIEACKNGFAEIAQVLVAHKAKLQHAGYDGKTALHFAARIPAVDTASVLVENGSEVNATDKSGCTPLFDACECDNSEVIEFLLKHGAHIEHTDQNGFTPLHCATQNKSTHAVETLCQNGASLNTRDSSGRTPLVLASQCGSEKCAPIIVRYYDRERRNEDNESGEAPRDKQE